MPYKHGGSSLGFARSRGFSSHTRSVSPLRSVCRLPKARAFHFPNVEHLNALRGYSSRVAVSVLHYKPGGPQFDSPLAANVSDDYLNRFLGLA